MGRTDFVEFNT